MFSELAIMNLLHGKWRSVLIVGALATIVMLIFFHIGIYDALKKESSKIYQKMKFDLVLLSSHYFFTRFPGTFPLGAWKKITIPVL